MSDKEELSVSVSSFLEIPIDRLHEDDMNVNEQTDDTFNHLVEDIKRDGFDEPLQVCHCNCEKIAGPHYVIVGGAHRWRAMTLLGVKAVPCSIKNWDEKTRRMRMVRRNLLRGETNDAKLTRLAQWFKEEDPETTNAMLADAFGFDSEAEYLKHMVNMNEAEEATTAQWLKDAMKSTDQEVTAVDSMSDVLNNIFSMYGDTLPQSFLFFAYKGKTHLMCLMNEAMYEQAESLVDKLKKSGKNINEVMVQVLKSAGDSLK